MIIRKMWSILLAVVLSLIVHNSAMAFAGKVIYSYGQVNAVNADGVSRGLARGDPVDAGDSINTRNGRTQIRFTDGGFVALQPNTTYQLEEYVFEGTVDGTEKSFFHLVKGGVRLVTGAVGRLNKDNFRLSTPVATIGIRGTSGKCSHHEATGTELVGYGGIWDLNSGAFHGPVEPGQAYSCDGSGCVEIPGFGQRQDTTEGEDEEEGEEEQEEQEEEGEEEEGE